MATIAEDLPSTGEDFRADARDQRRPLPADVLAELTTLNDFKATVSLVHTLSVLAAVIFIALCNGKKRPGSKFGPGWAFIPQFEPHRDDLAFVRQVLDDATRRHGIDRARVLMTGYSIGGSQTSYLACKDPSLAAAMMSALRARSSEMAMRASALVLNFRRSSNSHSSVAKKLSHMALS